MKPLFRDRRDAGRVLAAAVLAKVKIGTPAPVVLALPRGGVPVGFEVASTLKAPLDVCVVRRVEIPDGSGALNLAVASGRVILSQTRRAAASQLSELTLTRIAQKEGREINRRERAYRGEHPEVGIAGRRVVLVDDGLGAPETFIAAVAAVRARAAASVIVAVPVANGSSYCQLRAVVDDLVCLEIPAPFHGIGAAYVDFAEISDRDVRSLHEAARNRAAQAFLD
jgi:predicted phosphoribosyltransferase